jgi:hypothetical protein
MTHIPMRNTTYTVSIVNSNGGDQSFSVSVQVINTDIANIQGSAAICPTTTPYNYVAVLGQNNPAEINHFSKKPMKTQTNINHTKAPFLAKEGQGWLSQINTKTPFLVKEGQGWLSNNTGDHKDSLYDALNLEKLCLLKQQSRGGGSYIIKCLQILLVLLTWSNNTTAQPTPFTPNLVHNPSFEYLTSCPFETWQLLKAYPWFDGYATPGVDIYGSNWIFNSCAIFGVNSSPKMSAFAGVPKNGWGNQLPRTGNGYAGIRLINVGEFSNIKTYLEVSLTDALQAGERYCVDFYISRMEKAGSTTKVLQAYFTTDTFKVAKAITFNNEKAEIAIPNVQFTYKHPTWLNDTQGWMQVSGSFVAKGGERFMSIGNFEHSDTASFITDHPEYNLDIACYYIDDVSVYRCSRDFITATAPARSIGVASVQPAVGRFSVQNMPPNTSLWLYNGLGQLVYYSPDYKNNFALEGYAGIYFYKIIDANKQQYNGKFVVE